MKAIRHGARITTLTILLCAALLLTSCSFFQAFTVESLIRPPKLTGENALIEKAFEAAVNKDVMFISPIAGDYRTAFVQFDVDADGTDDTLVFYAKKESPNEAHMHLLKFDGENWYSAGDITGNGSEVYSVAFYQFDQDASYEVAVCWTVSDSRRSKTLSLYKTSLRDDVQQLKQLSVIPLVDYLILDFDDDGLLELMYLMDNSSDAEQPFKVNLIKMDPSDDAFHFVCELSLHQSVNLPLKISYDIRVLRCTLYVDCVNADGTYMTEIFYYDTEKALFSRMVNAGGAELSELTVRNTQVYCADIDNDRIVEVPVQREWDGATVQYPEAENSLPMSVIEFTKRHDNELLPMNVSYFYAPDAQFRFRTDEFLDEYVASYDATEMLLQMFTRDENASPLFSVQFVPLAAHEAAFNIIITEPEVSLFTEKHIKSLLELIN